MTKTNEMVTSSQLATGEGKIISIMSLFSLYQFVLPIESEDTIINITSKFITMAPVIKPETKEKWLEKIVNKL